MNADIGSKIASFSNARRAFACVNREWYVSFSHEQVWKASLLADFGLSELCRPVQDSACQCWMLVACTTYQSAWQAWRIFELSLPQGTLIQTGTLWARSIRLFQTLRNELEPTNLFWAMRLNPGQSRLPPKLCQRLARQPVLLESFQALYGIHNGQSESASSSLFGLTKFYHKKRKLFWLPLDSLFCGQRIVIAVGSDGEETLWLDNRELQIGNNVDFYCGFASNIVPLREDILLFFFESFVRDVVEYKRSVFSLSTIPTMSAFPQSGPHSSEAITRGNIRVLASYKFIPSKEGRLGHYLFVYQIRIGVLLEKGLSEPIKLLRRHWEISPGNHVVDGEGVIGLFPILTPQTDSTEASFVYESCTYADVGTTMEGYFTFAPLNLLGEVDFARSFPVYVGKLTFQLPLFAF